MHARSTTKRIVANRSLLPFAIILEVIGKDPIAMTQIIQHYDRFMDYLSTCHIRSEEGFLVPFVNMEIKDRLTSKLIQAAIRFSLERFEIEFKSHSN